MNKNICFVITKSEIGGAQKWVKEQIDVLNELNFNCYVFTNQNGWLTENSKSSGILTMKSIEKRTSLRTLIRLIFFIKKNNINLLVGNSANGGIYSRIAAFLTQKKCIYVSHGWSSVYNGGRLAFLLNLIERILALLSNKILCVSNNDFQIAKNIIKIPEKKLVVIPNKILPIKSDALHKNTYNPNLLKILFLGRLSAPKNPLPLIKAVENNPNYYVEIVGDGSNYSEIKEYIRYRKINNVILKGEIRNFNAFDQYDIFCLISNSEGLPLSAIEALSSSLPILISNVGGCPELVKDNGYLTDNTIEDIQKGLNIIQKNFDFYSNNSLKLFHQKFDLKRNSQEYTNLYENA